MSLICWSEPARGVLPGCHYRAGFCQPSERSSSRLMRRLTLVFTSVLAFALAAAPTGAATTKTVNWVIQPVQTLSVKTGTTVKWVWTSGPHNVVVKDSTKALFWSGALKTRGTYSHRFTKAGTYRIICDLHDATMIQTLTVK